MSDRHPHIALRLSLCSFCPRGDQPVTVCGQRRSPGLYRQQQSVSSSSFSLNFMLTCVFSDSVIPKPNPSVWGVGIFSVCFL